jgi:hypothetical protein
MANPKMTIAEARRTIHDAESVHSPAHRVIAAHVLMEACEDEAQVSLEDMLRCLDHGGSIATVGARCLYVRTGRDDLGWRPAGSNGLPYVMDRADWEAYLRDHHV